MDNFDISFVKWKLSRSRELTKRTLLDPDHFPRSPVNGDSVMEKSTYCRYIFY